MKRTLLYNAFVCTALMTLVSLLGCERSFRKQQSSGSDKYKRFLSEIGIGSPPSKLIIVPTQGCGPCIKATMDFLRDSPSSSDIAVVISGPSEKSCLLLMKKFNVQRNGVVFDSKFRSKDFGIITIYPIILSYKNDSWESIDITPENYERTLASRQL